MIVTLAIDLVKVAKFVYDFADDACAWYLDHKDQVDILKDALIAIGLDCPTDVSKLKVANKDLIKALCANVATLEPTLAKLNTANLAEANTLLKDALEAAKTLIRENMCTVDHSILGSLAWMFSAFRSAEEVKLQCDAIKRQIETATVTLSLNAIADLHSDMIKRNCIIPAATTPDMAEQDIIRIAEEVSIKLNDKIQRQISDMKVQMVLNAERIETAIRNGNVIVLQEIANGNELLLKALNYQHEIMSSLHSLKTGQKVLVDLVTQHDAEAVQQNSELRRLLDSNKRRQIHIVDGVGELATGVQQIDLHTQKRLDENDKNVNSIKRLLLEERERIDLILEAQNDKLKQNDADKKRIAELEQMQIANEKAQRERDEIQAKYLQQLQDENNKYAANLRETKAKIATMQKGAKQADAEEIYKLQQERRIAEMNKRSIFDEILEIERERQREKEYKNNRKLLRKNNDEYCQGTTQAGEPCNKLGTHNGYCHLHIDQMADEYCPGTNSDGGHCNNKKGKYNGYCYAHKDQFNDRKPAKRIAH